MSFFEPQQRIAFFHLGFGFHEFIDHPAFHGRANIRSDPRFDDGGEFFHTRESLETNLDDDRSGGGIFLRLRSRALAFVTNSEKRHQKKHHGGGTGSDPFGAAFQNHSARI